MIPLYKLLKLKYPDIDTTECVIANDGNGTDDYILKWDTALGSEPTEAELNQWRNDYQNTYLLTKFKTEANALIEQHVDNVAKERGYKDAVSCASYNTDPKFQWRAEAEAFINWRSQVWDFVIAQFTLISSQQAPIPTMNEIIPSLPTITWPE